MQKIFPATPTQESACSYYITLYDSIGVGGLKGFVYCMSYYCYYYSVLALKALRCVWWARSIGPFILRLSMATGLCYTDHNIIN